MHYWFDEDGNGKYHTWDFIEKVKVNLEKEHRKQKLKLIIKFMAIPFVFVYAILTYLLTEKFPVLKPYYNLFIIPVGGILSGVIFSILESGTSTECHKFRLKRFKELYQEDFDLEKSFWKKVTTRDTSVNGGKLGILEYMSRIKMRQN